MFDEGVWEDYQSYAKSRVLTPRMISQDYSTLMVGPLHWFGDRKTRDEIHANKEQVRRYGQGLPYNKDDSWRQNLNKCKTGDCLLGMSFLHVDSYRRSMGYTDQKLSADVQKFETDSLQIITRMYQAGKATPEDLTQIDQLDRKLYLMLFESSHIY